MEIAHTRYGAVRGVSAGGYTVFRGIPYAAAPTGERRFCPPQPPAPWKGMRPADAFPPIAPQLPHAPGSFYHKEFYADEVNAPVCSEDCLYLNIWTPADTPADGCPVVVWIHGGAFRHGYGHEITFDGEAFCKRGIILVTIQYRVGALGYLAHPWLALEDGANGNWGLRDQVAALEWVRDNIAAFGGDPQRVTIMGQSAGSFSVQALVCNPAAKGLFSGAILQSGGGYRSGINRDIPLAEALETGESFVRALDVDTPEALRALPYETILAHQDGYRFAPVIDGAMVLGPFDEVLEAGMHADVPYLIGSTADDMGRTPAQKAAGEKTPLYQGCLNWSFLLETLGRKPAYVYYFTRRPLGDDAGAFHSAELWYMFGTLGRSWRPKEAEDYAISERMVDSWSQFIKTGDPTAKGTEAWRPCARDDAYVQVF